jgi:hypothetical protein
VTLRHDGPRYRTRWRMELRHVELIHPIQLQRLETDPRAAATARLSHNARDVAMPFRIVGHHQHRAVVAGHAFCCVRQTIVNDIGLSFLWSVLKDDTLLKSDCRTLNDAKKLCRAAANEVRRDFQPQAAFAVGG